VFLLQGSVNRYRLQAVMPYDWEGNRRSGVALAMRRNLKRFIRLRACSKPNAVVSCTIIAYGIPAEF